MFDVDISKVIMGCQGNNLLIFHLTSMPTFYKIQNIRKEVVENETAKSVA